MDRDYESEANLGIYLNFHYAEPGRGFSGKFGMDRLGLFHENVLDRFLRISSKSGCFALDLGCGVGGASFHLSRHFDSVSGMDYSESFVRSANRIKETGSVHYRIRTTANGWENAIACMPPEANPEKVRFVVGDACDSACFESTYDCVIALNLLCRTRDPKAVVENIAQSVSPGGQVILSMPLSWSREFTPEEKWIVGDPLAFLQQHLGDSFLIDGTEDIPFLMRETERKHHWCIAHCSSWTKKNT
jgi:SAM-dependent methyltransferase